ncbi:MAG: protein kinase [Candidatus Krumholzibacteriota bacterium]|nr:protein kinase [Candidatus Krumholzibacteriota bacterium]
MTDHDFLVRYRLPRPLSRAWEAVCVAASAGEREQRVRWCASVAVRFLAALRQASCLAADPGEPVNPPAAHDLKRRCDGEVFPPELDGPLPPALLQLAGDWPGSPPGPPEAALNGALAAIDWLARYRLAILEPEGLRLLLGPLIEYRPPGGAAILAGQGLPLGEPVLLDPVAGRWLGLAPLLTWERSPRRSFGHLRILRRRDALLGQYVEEGEPGSPSRVQAIGARPRAGQLALDDDLRAGLAGPPARYPDGASIEGRYRSLGLVWRGGTSDVFIARREADGKAVVLKTHESEEGRFDENWRHFVDEERFSARVDHAAVIRSRPTGLVAGRAVHELDLAGRGSLQDVLDSNGVLDPESARRVALDLLAALAAVHAAGVIHNDLKPDNILFDEDGRLRLIDFGIATTLEPDRRELRPGAPPGTPGYMAPELREGTFPGVASDLYSAGVILAEMLGGKQPAGPAEVWSLRAVPAALRGFLARCLDPDPRGRWRSAASAARALSALKLKPVLALSLDVEGTLIDSYYGQNPRPGLADFLAWCLTSFDRVFVYTMLEADEAEAVFASLADLGELPPAFLDRYEYVSWDRDGEGTFKDLRRCRVPLDRNALVDDSPGVIPEDQAHRWVRVAEYHDTTVGDTGLVRARAEIAALFGLEA